MDKYVSVIFTDLYVSGPASRYDTIPRNEKLIILINTYLNSSLSPALRIAKRNTLLHKIISNMKHAANSRTSEEFIITD
jgi:hypothetical protein